MSTKKYVDLDGLSHFKAKTDLTYVAQEAGKGLSTEDYTTAEKTKLAGVEAGAEENVIESIVVNGTTATISNKTATVNITAGAIDSISVNGVAQTIDANKNVDITVPTKTSDLTNDDNVVKDAAYVHTDNNYTTTEKTKLSGIATGAEVNAIDTIKVNGTTQTITSKAVDITVPTSLSDLDNDAANLVHDGSYVHTDNNFTTALKTKLEALDADAEENIIETVKVNGTALTPDANKAVDITVPTNNNQLTNGAGYQTASDVETAINSKISSTYKAKGSVTFANLPALTSTNEGFVYNVSDAFTTTSDFVEGAGKSYPAGTNVVIIDAGSSTYKYDVLSGFVDLSGYILASELIPYTNAEIDTIFE